MNEGLCRENPTFLFKMAELPVVFQHGLHVPRLERGS